MQREEAVLRALKQLVLALQEQAEKPVTSNKVCLSRIFEIRTLVIYKTVTTGFHFAC